MRAARANGGQLSVTQVLERDAGGPRGLRTSGSTYDTVEHQIGSLQGTALLNPRFDPMRDLREISEVFEPHVQADADAAFYYVAGMGEAQRNRLAAGLQAATRRGASVAATLVECRQFFSEANIRLLATWGQHPYQERPVTVQFGAADGNDCRRFEIRKPYFQHRLPPEFWTDIGAVDFAALSQ